MEVSQKWTLGCATSNKVLFGNYVKERKGAVMDTICNFILKFKYFLYALSSFIQIPPLQCLANVSCTDILWKEKYNGRTSRQNNVIHRHVESVLTVL
jgi:hypothetical protein